MAESARQKRMRELGVLDSGTTQPDAEIAQPVSTGISKRQQRMMELGAIPDTRSAYGPPSDIKYNQDPSEQQQDPGAADPHLMYDDPAGPPNPNAGNNWLDQNAVTRGVRDYVFKPIQQLVENPAMLFGLPGKQSLADNPISNAIAEYNVPDAPYLDQPGTNARQSFLDRSGQEAATGVSKFIGQAAAPFFVPGAGLGTGSAVRGGAEALTSRLAPGLGQTVAREAAIGGTVGFGSEYAQGQGDLGQAAITGAAGAALGGAFPLIGRGIGAASRAAGRDLAQAVERPSLGSAVDDFTKRVNADSNPSISASEGPSYSGVNLLSRGKITPSSALPDVPKIEPAITGKPMTDISEPNNPDTIISRLGEQVTGDQNVGISAFGKKAGAYDNLSTDTKSQLVTKTAREPINARDVTDAGYRKMVDDQYRFKDFDKHAEKVLGRKLNPSEQTHTLALNSRGSDMITHHILTEDLVDINGNVIGRSLKNATQQIPKNKLVDFEDYQVLRHSMFRMDRKENVFHNRFEMTPDKAAQKVAAYEASNPEFKKIADELYGFRRNLVKSWLVDTGLVARKTWDGVMENNPFYVSNNRQFLSTEKGGGGAKKGFARQSSPLKPAPGSQRKIISPTESDIEHVDQYVKAGKRNQVMQNVVTIAQKDPEAFDGFLEIMPMTDNIKQSELTKLNALIEKDGVEGLIENINNQFDELFNQAKVAGKKDLNNTISVMFNGEPVWVKVHDAPFLEALTSLTPQAQGVILEGARQTTRVMKMLTTGVNPVFSLTRNLVRDVPMSYVASKTTDNPLRFGWDFLDSVINILGNKEMYKSFKSIGGGHSSSIAADRNMLAQSKREILPQRNVRSLPGRILSSVENFTNALETAPRLGEYKRLTQAGNNSPDSKIQGLYEANDVTVNFKRRGNVGREIDAFVPYFNAAIQGLDKTMRTFKDKPVSATLKAVGAISLPSMLLYAINYNNPDYKKLDNRTKDLYYLIPNGDGTFTKLPKPREGGAVFGSSIERVMRSFYEHDPDAFKGFAETVRNSFTPPVAAGLTKPGSVTDKLEGGLVGDSILGPLSDLKSNKDFAERPIVPKYMEGLSPELQYDERTSELSKWIGSKINASPKQLDYLLKSYSGIIGQLGVPLNSEGGSLSKALKQQVTADPTYSNSVFTDFYDNKDKLDTAEKDFKLTGVEPKGYNPGDRKYLDRISTQISKVRTTMRQVQSDKSLAPADKEKQLKELQVLMTSIAEDANIELKKSN